MAARLVTQHNGNILLDLPTVCNCDLDHDHNPVFAFLFDEKLHGYVTASIKRQRLMGSKACLVCAYRLDLSIKLPLDS